jgi:hypothetical protein
MNDPLVLKMYSAAGHRIDAAETLEDSHPLDCLYLAGYGIECSLKSLVLARTPLAGRQQTYDEEFRGSIAHDFEWLHNKLRNLGFSLPMDQLKRLRTARLIWNVDLRYESKRPKAKELNEVLSFAKTFWKWTKERL